MKKRILIITNSLDMGGVQKSLVSLLKNLDYDKYDIDLLVNYEGKLKTEIHKKVNFLNKPDYFDWYLLPRSKTITSSLLKLGDLKTFFYYFYYIIYGLKIGNMGQARQLFFERIHTKIPNFTKKYDVAIDYSGNYKNLISKKVEADIKITWVHSDYRVYGTVKEIDEIYFSDMSKIVTISETAKIIINEEFPKLVDKVNVIQNISDKSSITEMAKLLSPFEYCLNTINIVDVTRLDENKGLELAIKTCKVLIERGYKLKWYIVGGGKEQKSIIKKINDYGVSDFFILLGEKSNPYPFIKNADIFVHCSYFEGKSVAIDEAKLLGVPVVVTNYPTARDQITDGFDGLIVEFHPDRIADGIAKLINDVTLYSTIKKNLSFFELPISESIGEFEKITE